MGLRLFSGGARKPAYDAYKLPIWVVRQGRQRDRLRPGPPGRHRARRSTVEIQNAALAGAAFKTVATVPVTSVNGTFTAEVPELRRRLAPALERDDLAPGGGSSQVKRFVAGADRGSALFAVRRARTGARRPSSSGMEDEGLRPLQPAPRRRRGDRRWQRARRRRRAHPRALVGDRAGADARHASPRASTPTDPTDPRYNWAKLDTAVAIVRAAGHAGDAHDHRPRARCGPAATPSKRNPRWKPEPDGVRRLRARRGHALQGRRSTATCSGTSPTSRAGCSRSGSEQAAAPASRSSPHVYRSLVRAAEPAVHAADPGSEVVIGELAPVGNTPISANTPMRAAAVPARDGLRRRQVQVDQDRPLQGLQGRPRATRFGYHPHPQLNAPDKRQPGHGRGAVRRPHAAVHGARQAARAQAAAARARTST